MANGYWVASIFTSRIGSESVSERKRVLSFVFDIEAILEWSSLGDIDSL